MRRFLLRRPPTAPRTRLQLVGLEDRAVPATFTVDSLSETAVAGKTTLRASLATAATNGEDDTIFLESSLSGATVTLTGGQMVLGETGKTVSVSFSDLTPPVLNAGGLSRVFSVPAGATASLNRLTLTNGKADKGGLISNAGVLTLDGLTLTGGVATSGGGAIFTDTGSTLTVRGSTVADNTTDGNGGGIADNGATLVTVSSSLVDSNVADGLGGGIITGNATLVQATISRNVATDSGGGVWYNGALTVVNSTVVGNYADAKAAGGAIAGGGLFQGGTTKAVLNNTLVAGNRVGLTTNAAAPVNDLSGAVDPASGFNLISDAGSAGGLTDATNGNLVGVGGAGVRPLAEIVADVPAANGAVGHPLTLALAANSKAINAGKDALAMVPGSFALANDARGFPFVRLSGVVDIGAFEAQNVVPVLTLPTAKLTILEDDTTGVTFSGAGKLVTVSDPLAVSPSYTVSLAGLKGKVTLGTTAGLTNLTGNGSAAVSFKAANLNLLNAALAGTKYVSDPDAFGTGGFDLTVDDGDVAAGGAKSITQTVAVDITPVIDPPTVNSPATAKDTPATVTLGRAAVDGPEVNYFKVTNLAGGALTYVGPLSPTPVTVTNGAVLRFAGSFINLTADDKTVFTFTPTAGFVGTATFDVQVAQGTYGEPPPGQTNPDPVFGGPVVRSTITVGTVVPPIDTTAPTARLGTAPQATTGPTASYDFTVVYSDNVAVTAASLAGTNVRVTGPNGYSQLVSFVSATPTGDAASLTATYRLTAAGGVFPTAAAAGSYTISLLAGQVKDAAGNAAAAATLGTFTVVAAVVPPTDTVAPTAKLGTAANVTTFGSTSYDFTVAYSDNVAVAGTSLAATNVRVTGPNGFSQLATLVSATPTGNAAAVTATYRITPTGGAFAATNAGTYTISLEAGQVKDTSNNAAAAGTLGTFTVSGTTPPPATKPLLVGFPQYAVGTDRGGDGSVRFFNPDGSARLAAPVQPFGTFTGGVRTASADFNGDGVADIVAGTGPGRATQVVVLDGKTQAVLFTVDPFEASFTGGVYVAAGDVTGDGRADLVITPDEGGGPRVRLFNGNGFGLLADFFGIEDAKFRGGARAAVGDVDGDGRGDLVVAAGFGGGPRMAVFGGASVADQSTWVRSDALSAGGTETKLPKRIAQDFFAFEETLRNGAFVTVGDIDGDGKADLVAGGGPGGGPRVLVYSGGGLLAGQKTITADFFAGDQGTRGGVRLAVKDLDADGKADVVTGSGTGAGSKVVSFTGKAIAAAPNGPTTLVSADAVAGFSGGVFVG